MRKQLEEILKLSVEERILMVEAIWDSIPEDTSTKISQEQLDILNERDAKYEANPKRTLSLEEANRIIDAAI